MKFLQQSTVSERVTAALSTLFAIAILGVAVTAQQRETLQPIEIDSANAHLAQLEAGLIEQLDIAYRHDTRLLEAKVAEFNRVLKAWQTAPPSDERDAKLAVWIRDAMRRSMPGRNQPLPAAPDFRPTVAETSPSSEEAVFSEPALAAAAPSEKPSQEWPASDIVDLEEFAPRPIDPHAAAPKLAPTPVDWDHLEAVGSDAETPDSETPGSETTRSEAPGLEARLVYEAAREVPEDAPQEDVAFDDVSKDASKDAADETANEFAIVKSPEKPFPTAKAEESVIVGETLNSPSQALIAPTPPELQTPAEPKVDINVRELSVRIAGYHEGLREVEAAIVNRGEDSARGLEGIVETLEELSVESDFVSLYYDLLTDEQRRFVRAPRSIDPTVARVQRRLEQAANPEHGDFLRPFDPSERAKLEALRNRLELLAIKVK